MRYLVATLFACACTVLTVHASDQFTDLPRDHWAYSSLAYLAETGVLEGYPDGWFRGEQCLTRYEFAQAVARLVETVDSGNFGQSSQVMVQALQAEFADELALFRQNVDELAGQVSAAEELVTGLEGRVAEQNGQLSALEEAISHMKPGPAWSGTFLDRWDFTAQGDQERFTHRIYLLLGYSKQIEEEVQVGWRFKVNTGNAPNSSTWVLGHAGKTAEFFLDRAYVKYTPSWFGSYLNADAETCSPRLDIYAGIYPNLSKDLFYSVFDTDFNYQGLGLVYHFNRDFQITACANIVSERQADTFFDDDTYLLVSELRYDNLALSGLDAWIGCYSFEKPGNLPTSYFADNSLPGFDFNNDGTLDAHDRFSTNFRTLKAGLQYTHECTWNKQLSVYAEYLINTASNAEAQIDAVNESVEPDIDYDSSDDTGYLIGAQIGATPAQCGDWSAFVRYKELGANVIIDGLGDAGVSGANVNSLEACFNWMWADNCQMGITHLINNVHNAFGSEVLTEREEQQITFVDWLFKF